MSDVQPPNRPLPELRTVSQVNLRSEASAASSSDAVLQKDVIVWEQGRDGDWVEVWVHGYVRKDYLTGV